MILQQKYNGVIKKMQHLLTKFTCQRKTRRQYLLQLMGYKCPDQCSLVSMESQRAFMTYETVYQPDSLCSNKRSKSSTIRKFYKLS